MYNNCMSFEVFIGLMVLVFWIMLPVSIVWCMTELDDSIIDDHH